MIQIPYIFDSNNNITAINHHVMNNHNINKQTFSNNMLYQTNSEICHNNQNQQNIETADINDVSRQPHNETSYHRQLAQNQAMALAQLYAPKEQMQMDVSFDDPSINQINSLEQQQDFVSTDLHKQSQNVSSSSTQPAVSNLVNQKPPVYTKWTEQEDELLRAAVHMYGPHKWSLIATHVPNRTPMQCSARWVGALNPSILKGRWTSQEDNALKEAVSHYINSVDSQGNPQPIPWNKVSKRIPQRTGAQCQARWTEALDPRIRKGKWSPSEDEILKEGVRMFGRCWIRIAEMIDGRTQRQCRTRWLQIKNKQSRVRNDDNVNGNDNNGTMLILTPPSTPAQRLKSVSSNTQDIIQGVILRSPPQMITTNNSTYNTLTSPISNCGQGPETPISSPEFSSNFISMADSNFNNLNNCNLYYSGGAYNQVNGTLYVDQINNDYNHFSQLIF